MQTLFVPKDKDKKLKESAEFYSMDLKHATMVPKKTIQSPKEALQKPIQSPKQVQPRDKSVDIAIKAKP